MHIATTIISDIYIAAGALTLGSLILVSAYMAWAEKFAEEKAKKFNDRALGFAKIGVLVIGAIVGGLLPAQFLHIMWLAPLGSIAFLGLFWSHQHSTSSSSE